MRRLAAVSLATLCSVVALGAVGNGPRLVDIVKTGNREAVRTLMKGAVDVNVPEVDGTTALHYAVRADDLELVNLLLRAKANANAVNRYGMTPLALAAINGKPAMIEALLKGGADPNAALPEGETPLMRAARTGDAGTVKVLLAHGADVNAKERTLGETALIWAAAENHAETIKVLLASGADVNTPSAATTTISRRGGGAQSRSGWTPLMYAARQGAMDSTRALADAGANLNYADSDGTTPLIVSIINGHYDIAETLLHKGANPNVADSKGMTPLYAAVDMHTLPWMLMRSPPKPVDNLDSLAMVKVLLAHKANPNARLKGSTLQRAHTAGDAALGAGSTPFMRAAKLADLTIMRLLVENGANPTLLAKNHTTPIMLAAGLGFRIGDVEPARDKATESQAIDAIKLCLEYGVDIDAFNDDGLTAVHAAVTRGEGDQILAFLASQGAKLDTKDKRGHTPLDVALSGTSATVRGSNVRDSTAPLLRRLMGAGAPPTVEQSTQKVAEPERRVVE